MRRFHQTGKPGTARPRRGKKLPRQRKFETVIETKSGINVRSSYEKRTADYLFDNDIKFQYEPLMLIGGKQFRPDFFLSDLNLFLEICGYGHMPYYRDRQAQKEEIYRKAGLKSLFVHYDGKGSLEDKLEIALAAFRQNSPEQSP